MRAAFFKAHDLKYLGNAVAHGGRRREGEIDHAEGHAKAARGLLRDKLTHAGYLEGGFLYRLGDNVKRLALAGLERVRHNAGAGHAHVYHALRLAHAVESACHKGVILHSVGEHHKLCTAHRVYIRSGADDAPHERHGVHIYPGARGGDVDAGADKLRLRQGAA